MDSRLACTTTRCLMHPIALTILLSAPVAEAADGRIEVLRDKWGIPHVFAETDAGALYGLGYATAEDRGVSDDVLAPHHPRPAGRGRRRGPRR